MSRADRRTKWGERVGERLASAIEARYTQKEFARRLGRGESAVSIWVSGGVPEAWQRLRDVCAVAGCDANWLLGLDWPGLERGSAIDEVREPACDDLAVSKAATLLRAAVDSNLVSLDELREALARLDDRRPRSRGAAKYGMIPD